VDSNTKPRS